MPGIKAFVAAVLGRHSVLSLVQHLVDLLSVFWRHYQLQLVCQVTSDAIVYGVWILSLIAQWASGKMWKRRCKDMKKIWQVNLSLSSYYWASFSSWKVLNFQVSWTFTIQILMGTNSILMDLVLTWFWLLRAVYTLGVGFMAITIHQILSLVWYIRLLLPLG